MSLSIECLRTFVIKRLTVAAKEIFRVFQRKIDKYEDQVDYQRRLLESVWKPEVKLRRMGMYDLISLTRRQMLPLFRPNQWNNNGTPQYLQYRGLDCAHCDFFRHFNIIGKHTTPSCSVEPDRIQS